MSDHRWMMAVGGLLVAAAAIGLGRSVFAGGDTFQFLLGGEARQPGPLHRLCAPIKLLAVGIIAVSVVLTPLHGLWLAAALLAVLAIFSKVSLRVLFGRVLDLTPFVVIAAVGSLFGGDPARFGLILSRAMLVEVALVLLMAVTTLPEVVAGARSLRLPGLLVAMFALALRYLVVLLEEGSRMGMAFQARAVGPRDLRLARPLGRVVGSLAVRSLERSGRIHQAMMARGFTGELPVLAEARRPYWGEVAGLLVLAAALGGAAWWARL